MKEQRIWQGPLVGCVLALVLGFQLGATPAPVSHAESDKPACSLHKAPVPARPAAPAPKSAQKQLLTLPGKENPHGRATRCGDCHAPGQDASASTFRGDACVDCHDPKAHLREIHPTDFSGSSAKAPSPADARLKEGRSTCLTCHAINCNPSTSFRVARENRSMLRGGPWPRETDFCYQCHTRDLYKQSYPHGQSEGLNTCWYCHGAGEGDSGLPGKGLQLPQGELCLKCHKDVKHEREHVGRSVLENRLKMDTAAALERFQAQNGVTLPLGPGGTIGCATCHSPNPACSGGGVPASKLLRAAKERICYACHDL